MLSITDIKEVIVCMMSYVESETLANAKLALPDIICEQNHQLWRHYTVTALSQMFPHLTFDENCKCNNWLKLWTRLQDILVFNKALYFGTNTLGQPINICSRFSNNDSLQQIFFYDLFDVLAVYLSTRHNQVGNTIDISSIEEQMFRPSLMIATEVNAHNILQLLLQYNNIKVELVMLDTFIFADHFQHEQQANQIFKAMVHHPSISITACQKKKLMESAFASIFFSSPVLEPLDFVQTLLSKTTTPYDIPNEFFVTEQLLELCKSNMFGSSRFINHIQFTMSLLTEPLDPLTVKQCLEITAGLSHSGVFKIFLTYEDQLKSVTWKKTNYHKRAFLQAIQNNNVVIAKQLLRKRKFNVLEGCFMFNKPINMYHDISILSAVCTNQNIKMIQIVLHHISNHINERYNLCNVMKILYMIVDCQVSSNVICCFEQFARKHGTEPYFRIEPKQNNL